MPGRRDLHADGSMLGPMCPQPNNAADADAVHCQWEQCMWIWINVYADDDLSGIVQCANGY